MLGFLPSSAIIGAVVVVVVVVGVVDVDICGVEPVVLVSQ